MFKCMPFARCNKHVELIDKRHQNLTSFPDDVIRYYRTLEELLLDSNQLHDLPKGFYKLTQLKKLDISDNEIERLSPEIGNFTNLIEFYCNRNDIQEIPESIHYCKSLRVLDVSTNPLQGLPAGLTALRSLTELTLNDLSLASLPHDIGNLVNLRSLQSRDNLLKAIPESLCRLSKLELLDLGSNEIEEIPYLIGHLSNLKELWLDLNQIKQIPAEIGNLKKLQYLELSENMLETIPDEISGCVALTDLHLTQNSIEYLPSTIGQLKSLLILKLEQNQMVVLTPSIGQCVNLNELILTENLLSEIPNTIENLKQLTNLNVDRNRLTYIPDEICECENLGLLSLRDNQLVKLPDDLGNLKKLHVLDVAGNKLAYLPYSLVNANLNAIWLAENQANAINQIKLQHDFDEETQKEVLTCYLLPQQNFHTPSMENLLQGSINTDIVSQNGALAQQQQLLQQQQQQQPQVLQQQTSQNDSMNQQQKGESVRFAPDSDNEDKSSHFVRTNTPHPKELAKKKEQMRQRQQTAGSTTTGATSQTNQSGANGGLPNLNESTSSHNANEYETKPASNNQLPHISFTNAPSNNDSMKVVRLDSTDAVKVVRTSEDQNENNHNNNDNNDDDQDNDDDGSVSRSNSYIEKHVGFNVNNGFDDDGMNGQCRLRRHDTPHHLKGARINQNKQIAPNEIKEILQRYSTNKQQLSQSSSHSPQHNQLDSPTSSTSNSYNIRDSQRVKTKDDDEDDEDENGENNVEDEDEDANNEVEDEDDTNADSVATNSNAQNVKKQVKLLVTINRQPGTSLGLTIAGGKSSKPHKEDDNGIFITKIIPGAPAMKSGLNVGDKLLTVNDVKLDDLTHQEAVDALSKAGNQMRLVVLKDVEPNKLIYLNLPPPTISIKPRRSNSNSTANTTTQPQTNSGFSINYDKFTNNVIVSNITDYLRLSELQTGDIIVQINGKSVDTMSEQEIMKYVENKDLSNEYIINNLGIFRPSSMTTQSQVDLIDDKLNNSIDRPKSITSTSTTTTITHETFSGAAPIDSSTPMRTNNKPPQATTTTNTLSSPPSNNTSIIASPTQYPIEEIKIMKVNGAMGLSIVGGGSVSCHPFGIDEPGIFVSKIVPDGAASRTNLRVGDRILKVNGIDITQATHDEAVDELKRNASQVVLTVRHDPQPSGLQEITLVKSYPEEQIGIRIHGGIESRLAELADPTDEGIFVVDVIKDSLAYRDGRLQKGMRIIEVNGNSLLGVKLSDAQSYLIKANDRINMVVCDGFNVLTATTTTTTTNNDKQKNGQQKLESPFPVVSSSTTTTTITSTNNTKINFISPYNKLQNTNNINSNYDNLRNIDSDDSMITTPEVSCVNTPSKQQQQQQHLVKLTTNNNQQSPLTTTTTIAQPSTTTANTTIVSNNNNSTNNTTSTPLSITDKNLSELMKHKTGVTSMSEIIVNGNVKNGNPAASESVRSFKDKMKFFETVKDRDTSTKQRSKFSYLQEHEIQNIKQEEERKMSMMSQDEIMSRSRVELGDDITSHKDYATFFSNSIDTTNSQNNTTNNNESHLNGTNKTYK